MPLPLRDASLAGGGRRTGTAAVISATLVAVLSMAVAPRVAVAQFQVLNQGGAARDGNDGSAGVYVPVDRSLNRAMARVRERLAAREYHQALTFLHDILQHKEDSFLEAAEGEDRQPGLKAAARQILRELPDDGHESYELLYGAAARRALQTALAAGDTDGIAAVVRQYSYTKAGNEAGLLLAQIESDQGHFAAAAQIYAELLDVPRAVAQFGPQLFVLAGQNRLAAHQPDAAAAILRTLIERHPNATVELLGVPVPVPGSGADLAAWLLQRTGQPAAQTRTEPDWLVNGGDPTRNAHRPGGRPHLHARWEARVVNSPSTEAFLTDRSTEFAMNRICAIPVARPIALGDLVVMRTPHNVVAVNWQSGKRVWETRDDQDFDSSTFGPGASEMGADQFAVRGTLLEQRMWDDALVMSLASDGERVFVLRSDGWTAGNGNDMVGWPVAVNPNRPAADNDALTNQLSAYEVESEGKLAWELDGARASGSLAGAFFLGAPIVVDDTLFVMAEIRSAVYLVAIDPATGAVQWQQQLVGLEQGIMLDPARRLIGAAPSYASGVLVCPTAAGAVIAVDVVKREFAWVFRYRRETMSPAEMRNFWPQQPQAQSPRANDGWLDSLAVVVGDRVLIAPPASADLYCVDLHTGKVQWTQRRGDALFIGCADAERALLVEPESIRAMQMTDGEPAWEQATVPLPGGSLPSGRGYLSDNHYYLPLLSGQLAVVELSSGNTTKLDAGPQGQVLGNLICHRGSIISQSLTTLSKFEQLDALKERSANALAANPDDATALCELAELKQADGQHSAAIAALKRALELAPNDALPRDMLADLLLQMLTADYKAFQHEVPLAASLIHDQERRLRLLRLEAEGLIQLGERRRAWEALMRLADASNMELSTLAITGDYTVRSDRWLCGQFARLWREASPVEQIEFGAQLEELRRRLLATGSSTDLETYLSHFQALPGATEFRLALAKLLIEQRRLAEAELRLLAVTPHADVADQATQAALMTKLLLETGEPLSAAPWIARLRGELGDVPLFGKTTGSEWLAELGVESGQPLKEPRKWPRGAVDVELSTAPARNRDAPRGDRPQERQPGFRPLRVEQDVWPATHTGQWFISVDCSQLVCRDPYGYDNLLTVVEQNNWARQFHDSNLVYAARLGHLLFVGLSGQVVAIDAWPTAGKTSVPPDVPDAQRGSLASRGNLLWQSRAGDQLAAAAIPGRPLPPAKASRRPVYHAWSNRKRIPGVVGTVVGSLGPATPQGVVFQDGNELRCVDPLSGETLWSRSDLPHGCELFGDAEYVLAADVSDHKVYVVALTDGRLVDTRELPKAEWLTTAGRNVAQLGVRTNGANRALQLQVNDIRDQRALFDGEYHINSRACVLEPAAVAVLEPSGKFELIDVQTGRRLIAAELEAMADLRSLQALRCGETVFVLVGGQALPQAQKQHRPVDQLDKLLADGRVYAFDLRTGRPLWPSPAVLRNRALVAQPADIPYLIFLDRQTTAIGATGTQRQLRLLCLDKLTGETVYRNDNLPDSSVTRYQIRAERRGTPHVTIDTNAGSIRLTATERPHPPRPPADDTVEAASEPVASAPRSERGLAGLGQRVGAALRGTIQKEAEQAAPPPASDEPLPLEPQDPIDDDD